MTNQQITDLTIIKQIMKEKNDKKRQHQLEVFIYNKSVKNNQKGR